MTRLERKEAELQKELDAKAAAIHSNNVMWLALSQKKIESLKKEIEEIKRLTYTKLSDVLKDRPQSLKNDIYKSLLRISVLADVVNEACCQCKDLLKTLDLDDFTLRKEVSEMEKLSQKIASFVLAPKQQILEDFIVDNDEVVKGCIILSDRYLNEKLKL